MAKFVAKDSIILFDKRNISGLLNQIALEYSAELQDDTTFGDSTRSRIPGLLDVTLNINGYWDAGLDGGELSADLDFFNNIGAANAVPTTVIPGSGAADTPGFFFNSREASYNPGATIGEIFAFSIEINSAGPLVSGLVAHNGILTTTTNGASITLPAVGANQSLFAVQHVVNTDGDSSQTLNTLIVSDANDSYGSPITQITFAEVTTLNNAQLLSKSGVNTDTEYRAEMTVAGTGSPTFTVIIVIGII